MSKKEILKQGLMTRKEYRQTKKYIRQQEKEQNEDFKYENSISMNMDVVARYWVF